MSCTNFNQNKSNRNLDRVESAVEEKKEFLTNVLVKHEIEWEELNIFIRGFKQEQILEVWAKNQIENNYQKITEYDFCKLSGKLGPKRKEGDLQVPEGFYIIDRFNSKSNYYLSLGINYPNKSDKIRGDKSKPGSDIFIHGDCVTIGCIPITDDKIKELFILAQQAKNNGQIDIGVHIYPTRLSNENLAILSERFNDRIDFWKELKVIYDWFEINKETPEIEINEQGQYTIK